MQVLGVKKDGHAIDDNGYVKVGARPGDATVG